MGCLMGGNPSAIKSGQRLREFHDQQLTAASPSLNAIGFEYLLDIFSSSD